MASAQELTQNLPTSEVQHNHIVIRYQQPPAHNKVLINMGIAFQIPMGYYGQIAPKSGLALHHHIHVGAGVVDPNYTGPVQVLLLNFSHKNHTIEANNHIVQLILERIAYPILCEVAQIPPTERGAQGFG